MNKDNLDMDEKEEINSSVSEETEEFVDFEAISREKKRVRAAYTVAASLGAVIAGFLIYMNKIDEITEAKEKWLVLSNIFFSSGVIIIMLAGILWSASKGMFSGIGFSFKGMLGHYIPIVRNNMPTNYYDYLQAKKGRKSIPIIPFLVVGGIYLIPFIVFLVLYYTAG